jgi:hypothetical protein
MFSNNGVFLLVGSETMQVAQYVVIINIGFNADDESIFVHLFDNLERWIVENQ